ncbi:Uncharacterized protein SCF082_LOCUS46127 [Durusdinium trenchii]|uniref:Glycosyl transferase family 25 domain-containing protein n=1 Tax=Durusdinium trenchii TaxID=1381693 RepID=A0ABP0RCW3_9DINO
MRAVAYLNLLNLVAGVRDAYKALDPPDQSQHLSKEPVLLYYINTVDNVARRAQIEQQAKQLDLPLQRFRAVDTQDVAAGTYARYITVDPSESISRTYQANATVACFLSHVFLMTEIARNFSDDRIALIMEDDVVLPRDLLARLDHLLGCAPDGWTLLKGSSWGAMRSSDLVRPHRNSWQELVFQVKALISLMDVQAWITWDHPRQCPNIYRMHEPFTEAPPLPRSLIQSYPDYYYAGTGAYLIKVSSIPQVLRHLRSRRIKDIDQMMLSFRGGRPCTAGEYCPYQVWPYVVALSWRHWISSLLPADQVKKRVGELFIMASALLSLAILSVVLLLRRIFGSHKVR